MTAKPDVHQERFVQLADVGHDRALVGWGAFAFTREDDSSRWEIVDDEALEALTGRRTCIGASAEPYGRATVRVFGPDGDVAAEAVTTERTCVWLEGLEPQTSYRYVVEVDGEPWAPDECWDWMPSARGGWDLAPSSRRYDLAFRTFPDPSAETPPVRFAALGDFGVGVRADAEASRRQRRVARVLDRLVADDAVRFAVALGDTVYQGEQGRVDDESGGEDDDWYSSFFAPYRYALAQVPFFPAIGNHDASDTESSDDRDQLTDNLYLADRFAGIPGRDATEPGLFYRFAYGRDLELICVDTSLDTGDDAVHRYFQAPHAQPWLQSAFAPAGPRWRIPFAHHPIYCAGPEHSNDDEMAHTLLPLFDAGGVRLALAGHEHNFQINRVADRTFLISGAGGKVSEDVPSGFEEAGTVAWAAQAHLTVIEIDGGVARLTPIAGVLDDGSPHPMSALGIDNAVLEPPFVVQASGRAV